MKFTNFIFLSFIFLIGFAVADNFPEGLPHEISPEMLEEIPDEYMNPDFYNENLNDLPLDDENIPFLIDNFCPIIESRKSEILNFQLPKQVPLKNDIFNLYIAGNPIAFIEINEERILSDFDCGSVNDNPTYNIYISSLEIFNELDENTDYLNFYKENKKSGDIQIKGVGFGKKIKLFFLNIGVSIASWFI